MYHNNDEHIDDAIMKFSDFDEIDQQNIKSISNHIFSKLKNIPVEEIENRITKIRAYRQQLQKLTKLPFVKQRSDEWFEQRKNRLTASDLHDAIKGGATSLSLAKRKASVVTDNINYGAIPALKWGVMFEPMACRCYSQKYDNIKIHEFGLICDPNNEHFGASPDGINDLGIMIEIKCPYTRKIIDNEIPVKYQAQIQGQLAVCQLEECDYIECEFTTYEDEDEYYSNVKDTTINHGVIIEYKIDNEYQYIYSEANLKAVDAIEHATIAAKMKCDKFRIIYWKLIKMNVQRVKFNNETWSYMNIKIHDFWKLVEECRHLPPGLPKESRKRILFIDDE
jgi:putative phage-type endonuclease